MPLPNSGRGRITRRDFLKLGGAASLELLLSACGVSPQTIIPFPSSTPEATKTPFGPAGTYTPTSTPSPTQVPTPVPPALVELAGRASFTLGVELIGGLSSELYYRAVKSSFNLGVIHGGVYWRTMEPQQGFPDYSIVDQQLKTLQEQGLDNLRTLRGHPLYFPSTNPPWLLHGHFKAAELVGLLQKRINELVGRYRGKIREWVVVNEPYFPGAIWRKGADILYARVGKEYIDIAFQTAREADPAAVLIYNDTQNHTSGGLATQNTMETVERLRSRGLVDAVGLQMHLKGAGPPALAQLMQTMREYPVPVYITELDVDLSSVYGLQETRFATQAKIYRDVLLAALETGACKSLTLWGIGDKFSWLETSLGRPNADGTLFDDDFNPKPAYFALFELLEQTANGT
jgi:endo-1,4-beta-xylanase